MNLRRAFQFFSIGATLAALQPTQAKSVYYQRFHRGLLGYQPNTSHGFGVKGTFAVRTLRRLAGTNWRRK